MKHQDKERLITEIKHIFDSGANELRVYEMVVRFIEKSGIEKQIYKSDVNHILSTHPKAPELFNTSAFYRSAVECIIRGADPLNLLAESCVNNEKLTQKYIVLITNWPNRDLPNFND